MPAVKFSSDRVREARGDRSLAEFAYQITRHIHQHIDADHKPLSRQTVANWESGVAAPRATNMEGLCGFTGRPVSYFFGE